ncbi:hypothetical protein [Brevundimonas sp.]|uniref:hypothetical protein n=1 Tax=Brevundimonas sp. TaxID=1871086 RepID=UPI003F70A5E2
MSKVQLADGITVTTQEDDVFVELRLGGKVIAVAGMTLDAATDFGADFTAACVKALEARLDRNPAPNPGAMH